MPPDFEVALACCPPLPSSLAGCSPPTSTSQPPALGEPREFPQQIEFP
ncbi:hypothetical protein BDA96_05G130500 [Sorghum bicolor]|uniref:Uncharacterized protein n=2 Tax=Sorghum bicolor TaxID=4558 RepID=A0A1B6PRV9_SORBI|nr:hypothetical protein BDA96_05G130500 [Sorghum bicolor]KXG28392.1 hypothetical protein SORBI_3005G117500 [Sorghum bicolor]KXG28394.1 hypothetical protein SORBI_3005G117500 [Sorghum bicolor]